MQAQIKMHFTIANITEPNLRLETAHNEPNLAISKKIATKDGFFLSQLMQKNDSVVWAAHSFITLKKHLLIWVV